MPYFYTTLDILPVPVANENNDLGKVCSAGFVLTAGWQPVSYTLI